MRGKNKIENQKYWSIISIIPSVNISLPTVSLLKLDISLWLNFEFWL